MLDNSTLLVSNIIEQYEAIRHNTGYSNHYIDTHITAFSSIDLDTLFHELEKEGYRVDSFQYSNYTKILSVYILGRLE